MTDDRTPAPDRRAEIAAEGRAAWTSTSRSQGPAAAPGRARCRRSTASTSTSAAARRSALVGESGCGKSTTGRLLTRLLEPTGGTIEFEGRDITHLRDGAMRPLRRDIQMIFQDPYSSLNPRHTVGTIVGAPFRLQGVKPERRASRRRCRSCWSWSGSTPSTTTATRTSSPAASASASASPARWPCKPKLIVADEPVSALDVSIQAQVVNLLDDLQQELGLTYVIIAHDLSVVRHVSDRVAVMYLGKIVELADRDVALRAADAPVHQGAAVGRAGARPARRDGEARADPAHGRRADADQPAAGCRFHTRCWKAQEICATEEPPLLELAARATRWPATSPSTRRTRRFPRLAGDH